MKIFIAGCARSGTTLMLRLMNCFSDVASIDREKNYDFFERFKTASRHAVLKRRRDSHRGLVNLPADIQLIYMVRHPLEVLTSRHGPRRARFYVSRQRWRDEYASLKALRRVQPSRRITYVRYDELVTRPDDVQAKIAGDLGLGIGMPFSRSGIPISSGSLALYEKEFYRRLYVRLLPYSFRAELKEFCDEFGFRLPADFIRPASRPGEVFRSFVSWNMQKTWWRVWLSARGRKKK